MQNMYRIVLIVGLFFSATVQAAPPVLHLVPGAVSPPAKLQDVQWIAGHWRGEAFGGIAEEIWSPPLGDSMMASFKLVVDGKVTFYEIEVLRQTGETLLLQLKHFNGDLTGWEEKGKTVDFPLVKITENAAYFDGLSFLKISDTEMHVYVTLEDGGSTHDMLFTYRRVP